jgi:Secretion system C-terminal sorting domain
MISIPTPCNEDFDKMTPTARGAYCAVCSTNTFDFRALSNNDIYQIIDDNKDKHICGRFNKSQLESLNGTGYTNWQNQTRRTFQSKFLLACVLVFGFTLFSCETEKKSEESSVKIEQIIEKIESQSEQINQNIDLEISDIDLMDFVDIPEEEPAICLTTSGEVQVAGGIGINQAEYMNDNTQDYPLGGLVAFDDTQNDIDIKSIEIDSIQNVAISNPITVSSGVFGGKIYPNPTTDNSTLALEIETEGQFEIMLYNMNGQLVTNIHSGHLVVGRQTFDLNMEDFTPGMYLVKVISQGQNETFKIQKVN